MSLQSISTTNIVLSTSAAVNEGTKYPIFITQGKYFQERVRAYNSATSFKEDFPSNTKVYAAMTAYYSQELKPKTVYVGRALADTATLTPTAAVEGTIVSFVISILAGDTLAVNYTYGSAETAEDAVDAIVAAITGSAPIAAVVTASKVGVGAAATVLFTPVAATDADAYYFADFKNITDSYVVTELPADTLEEIANESGGYVWRYISTEDRSATYQEAMADVVEALEQQVYVTATSSTDALNAPTVAASNIVKTLYEGNYFRTNVQYYNDTAEWPECRWTGLCSVYPVGTLTWSHKELTGLPVAQYPYTDPNTGAAKTKPLTYTQMNNLSTQNANFLSKWNGFNIMREGKVSSGEWQDIVDLRDAIIADINAEAATKLVNASKVPYSDSGISEMAAVVSSVLNRYLQVGDAPKGLIGFKVTTESASSIPFADKAARSLNTITFICYLAGAIHVTEFNGTLTYQ